MTLTEGKIARARSAFGGDRRGKPTATLTEGKIVRARAPLRVGLAGGGSDVSPFCDQYGGHVLNATIQMFAYAHLEPTETGRVEFVAQDRQQRFEAAAGAEFPLEGDLVLHKAVYNRIVGEFRDGRPLSCRLTTVLDAPLGSGLGASSTMVVAILLAYSEWLGLPLGEYDLARLAYEIERIDAGLRGGRQDQYAAAFGGFNFMEFHAGERVVVNPLRVKRSIVRELEASIVLYFTGVNRESADLIQDQQQRVARSHGEAIAATLELKQDALAMKEALLKGQMAEIARVLGRSWEAKKRLAARITNPQIDAAYEIAIQAGAYSGRISGAGGGGFIIFVVDPRRRFQVVQALQACGGQVFSCFFGEEGAQAWTACR